MELTPSTKLKPEDFVSLLYPYAKKTQDETGMSAIAILAQAALESGWNSSCAGWSYFGVKAPAGTLNENKQLLTTTEYSHRSDLTFPEIISVESVIRNGQNYFKYKVKDYFMKYESPEECFTDHANFLIRNPRYSKALEVKDDPIAFVTEISLAGYATDPNYAQTLTSICNRISGILDSGILNS